MRSPDWDDPSDPLDPDFYKPSPASPPEVLEVDVTDNPVIAELLDADGYPIRQWHERPPIGFQPNRKDDE